MVDFTIALAATGAVFLIGMVRTRMLCQVDNLSREYLWIATLVCLVSSSIFFLATFIDIKYLYFFPLAVYTFPITVIDLMRQRIPNRVNLELAIVQTLSVVVFFEKFALLELIQVFVPGLVLFLFFFLVNLLSKGQIGMGDAKLAYSLAISLIVIEWPLIIIALTISFLLGGFYAIIMLCANQVGLKDKIAFGPFMILGTWAALLVNICSVS